MPERVAEADGRLFAGAPAPRSSSRSRLRLRMARSVVRRQLCTVSETFFVYDARVGLVAVAVLAVMSPRLAAGGLLASVLARLTAARAGASRALQESGLVELNGWFLGLACTTFFAMGPGLVVALLAGGALAAVFTVVMHRVLATWDVPPLLGPYLPAFWLLWSGVAAFAWSAAAALPTVAPPPARPILLVALGGLRGLGQIFFLPDARLGIGLCVAVSIADWRLGPAMALASIAAVGVSFICGSPAWQVEQGMAGFTAALVTAAALRGFAGLGWIAVTVAVVAGPFLEMSALRVLAAVGLPALSAPYVGLVWVLVLVRPVRDSSATRASWSMSSAAKDAPRIFESR